MTFSRSVVSSRVAFIGGGLLMLGLFGYSAMAGNLEMVEENVQELKELNEKAVKQIPNLPETGTVDLKAKVFYNDGSPVIDIYKKKITTEKDDEINFNQGYTVETEQGDIGK